MRRFASSTRALSRITLGALLSTVSCGPIQQNSPTGKLGTQRDTVNPGSLPNPAASKLTTHTPTLDSLRADVLRLIAEPKATSIETCRLVPFGAKPCGGPRDYLARAVSSYTAEDARLNQERGLASDYARVAPPQITFTAGHCTTRH